MLHFGPPRPYMLRDGRNLVCMEKGEGYFPLPLFLSVWSPSSSSARFRALRDPEAVRGIETITARASKQASKQAYFLRDQRLRRTSQPPTLLPPPPPSHLLPLRRSGLDPPRMVFFCTLSSRGLNSQARQIWKPSRCGEYLPATAAEAVASNTISLKKKKKKKLARRKGPSRQRGATHSEVSLCARHEAGG